MKCEIDIDLGSLADEWGPVAFRVPVKGEQYVSQSGCVGLFEHGVFAAPRLIVRRRWAWPEWLTAEWIFCNCHETWFAANGDPQLVNTGFAAINAVAITSNDYFAFAPPPCTDWRQSKRRNPRST